MLAFHSCQRQNQKFGCLGHSYSSEVWKCSMAASLWGVSFFPSSPRAQPGQLQTAMHGAWWPCSSKDNTQEIPKKKTESQVETFVVCALLPIVGPGWTAWRLSWSSGCGVHFEADNQSQTNELMTSRAALDWKVLRLSPGLACLSTVFHVYKLATFCLNRCVVAGKACWHHRYGNPHIKPNRLCAAPLAFSEQYPQSCVENGLQLPQLMMVVESHAVHLLFAYLPCVQLPIGHREKLRYWQNFLGVWLLLALRWASSKSRTNV